MVCMDFMDKFKVEGFGIYETRPAGYCHSIIPRPHFYTDGNVSSKHMYGIVPNEEAGEAIFSANILLPVPVKRIP